MGGVRRMGAAAALLGVILIALGVYNLIWTNEPAASVIGIATGAVLIGGVFLYWRAPAAKPPASPAAGGPPGTQRRAAVASLGLVASVVVGGLVSAMSDVPLLLVATPLAVG